jgi:hypothetical protein
VASTPNCGQWLIDFIWVRCSYAWFRGYQRNMEKERSLERREKLLGRRRPKRESTRFKRLVQRSIIFHGAGRPWEECGARDWCEEKCWPKRPGEETRLVRVESRSRLERRGIKGGGEKASQGQSHRKWSCIGKRKKRKADLEKWKSDIRGKEEEFGPDQTLILYYFISNIHLLIDQLSVITLNDR